jgi:hypothetical protein
MNYFVYLIALAALKEIKKKLERSAVQDRRPWSSLAENIVFGWFVEQKKETPRNSR